MVLSRIDEGLNVAGKGEIKDFPKLLGSEMKPETVRLR